MRILLLLFVFQLGIANWLNAQSNDCLNDFNYLVQKIKADYPGYSDKVKPESFNELQILENELRQKIIQYPDSCGRCLRKYTEWFKDNHLRVKRLWPKVGSTVSKNNERKYLVLNNEQLIGLQAKNTTAEGIWHSFRGDIAIIKDSNSDTYAGISISCLDFEKNQIVFSMSRVQPSEFTLISYPKYNDYAPIPGLASLRLDDRILELHDDTKIVRKTSSSAFDDALLYSYIPEFPNGTNYYPLSLRLSDSTFYLRITSFRNNETEKMVKKHWTDITSMPNLIIDIRFNSGGQDNYYQILSDLLFTNSYESKGVEWYATENNIKGFEDALKNGTLRNGEEGIRWTNSLLDEMKKHKGKFVVHPMMGADVIVKNDTIYPYPKRIGIIINEGNASSAEQFLLTAKQSSKAILFGNCNTAGVLDYSNAVPENFPSNKYELNFPMTRSRRLPDNPIDNVGISPDIVIPYPASKQLFDRLDQWVYFVQKYLELINKTK